MSDLVYSELENELRAGVRELLADRSAWPDVLEWTENDEPYDKVLWRSLSGLDAVGLPVPEDLGGTGLGWRETAVVLEELGRAVAPVPYLGSTVMATAVLLACGEKELLGEVARGEKVAALALPFSTPVGSWVRPAGVRVTSVADALGADVLLVLTSDGLLAVDASAAERTPVTSLDQTRPLCDITFSGRDGRQIAAGRAATEAVANALLVGGAMLASEQLGVAEQCLETTVAYVKTRFQFGRAIGSYQGLKHRLADLWVSITQARAAARHAAWCVSTGDADTEIAVAIAQAQCSAVVVKAAEECVQLHGGIGFTWEHPAHLYLKRAKSTSLALGAPHHHRALLASLVDLPG